MLINTDATSARPNVTLAKTAVVNIDATSATPNVTLAKTAGY